MRRGWQTTTFNGVLMVSCAATEPARATAAARGAKMDFMAASGEGVGGAKGRGEGDVADREE
jgi:hypothetical protein